jgi:hypothetical protein
MGNSVTFSYTNSVSRNEGAYESISSKISLTMEDDGKFTMITELFNSGDSPGGCRDFKIISDPHKYTQSFFFKNLKSKKLQKEPLHLKKEKSIFIQIPFPLMKEIQDSME